MRKARDPISRSANRHRLPAGRGRARRCSTGSARNPIIVGAYTDGRGGVCPMLAAHRNGGRTSFASFARAWDRYTAHEDVAPRHRARAAHARGPARGEHSRIEAETDLATPRSRELPPPAAPAAEISLRPPRRVRARPERESELAGRRTDELISGTTQSRLTCSRKRTASAMSSGWIISSAGTCSRTKSVIGVSTKPGHSASDLIPSPLSSLCIAWRQPDHGELRRRVDRQPGLAALAGDRGGVDHERLAVLGARLAAAGRRTRGRRG